MVSIMESDGLREQLQAVERGEAAPYIRYPPTPWWYAPACGAWVAALIGAFAWWRVNAAAFASSLAVVLAAEAVFVLWLRRRHGALPLPGRGKPPAEIAAVWRGYLPALPVIAVIVALTWWLGDVPAAAGTAFVLVAAGLAVYERRYARAAARVRSRLA
jgi:hypothetical protein